MTQYGVIRHACTQSNSHAGTPHTVDASPTDRTHTIHPTPRMTTQITTPTDDDAFTTDTTSLTDVGTRADRAPMMFSPTSSAVMGQFETEADDA
ncbi:hypothetical protein [Haloarcula ordinaria]|uniref:hypothetical protein n=2 Tax=Haloarcula TaxID=2237 RepID=UPI0023E85C09|nr:hypothetical protein [Halomicroarcula sp. ZS-22-S1]